MFKGILIDNRPNGYCVNLVNLDEAQLPDEDVVVRVDYSSLNYKDALALTGKAPIVKQFPLVPGIDLAGQVVNSKNSHYTQGDYVLVNGWGVGEKYWGGYAQKACLKSEWLTPLPPAFSTKQAMSIGTAGYTAMLAVIALERQGVTPDKGDVVVTGANGGVGSFAIMLLAKLGYRVVAVTGRMNEAHYLKALGAYEVIDRNELTSPSKPLLKERWAGAVDCVGSYTLANLCASMQYGGVVTACGLAQGMDFPSTVAPFILRGVTLVGIDSVMCPYEQRVNAWARLAELVPIPLLATIETEIPLAAVIDKTSQLMLGQVRGRVVVNLTT